MIQLLAETDAQLICGGGFLDLSLLNNNTFGSGNNVNLGYFPKLASQATTGGTAIAYSFNDNFSDNTLNPSFNGGAPYQTSTPSWGSSSSGRPSGWRRG